MNRQTNTSSFFLMVFGVCGLAYGIIADSIPLYTLIGVSVGITIGIVSEMLVSTDAS